MNSNGEQSALVRIHLFTYRRSHLLPRAVDSLLAQTESRWVCEVHNDDPSDPGPAGVLERYNDPRILLRTHERNLGAMASYNLAFAPTGEPFFAMLQDDNWWEPTFLQEALSALQSHPSAPMVTVNQNVFREEQNGEWRQQASTTWPTGDEPTLLHWPQWQQVLGARHGDGASVYRSVLAGRERMVPEELPFDSVEAFRERAIPHPILYLGKPLANFAVTRETARSTTDSSRYAAGQVLLAATFFAAAAEHGIATGEWLSAEGRRPAPRWSTLILAALQEPRARYLLRHMPIRGWLRFAIGVARRPGNLRKIRGHLAAWQPAAEWLHCATEHRAVESRAAGIRSIQRE